MTIWIVDFLYYLGYNNVDKQKNIGFFRGNGACIVSVFFMLFLRVDFYLYYKFLEKSLLKKSHLLKNLS